jgi:hypothetical protein
VSRASIGVALALAACGGDDGGSTKPPDAFSQPIDADITIDAAPPRETLMLVQPLQAGELVEAKMVGGTMDRAILHLAAPTATLDWNIHAHPNGGTVTVHEELKVMTADYDFIPSEQAEWFLLLRNSGQVNMDVQIEVELYGVMTFEFL